MDDMSPGMQAFLRAKFATDVGHRYDPDLISPDGYWKNEEEMGFALMGDLYAEDDAPYGYGGTNRYYAHRAK